MGACATKPKADATDAPAPLPEKDEEVVKNELTVASTPVDTKEVVDSAHDNSRSLSNLLKENEPVKGSIEDDKSQPEVGKEEACEAEKDTDISETKTNTEVVKSEILVETTSATIVDAAVEVKSEEAIEVESATEKTEILVEKAIPVVDVPAKVEKEESNEVEPTTETLEEKTSTPIICAVAENEADKEIEVASATEVQKPEAVEEKKIEEHDKDIETPISESIEVESAGGKTKVVEEKAVASATEVQKTEVVEETKNEEKKAVVTEEKTAESEVCAENVKP